MQLVVELFSIILLSVRWILTPPLWNFAYVTGPDAVHDVQAYKAVKNSTLSTGYTNKSGFSFS